MKTALALAAVLITTSAQAKPFMCVLFPKQCIEPVAAPVEPIPVPAPRPVEAPPAPTRLDAPPAVAHAPPTRPKPLPRIIRPKYKPAPAKARRRAATLPSWCARIPAGTTMERVDGAASLFVGRPLTAAERTQARACIKSKG